MGHHGVHRGYISQPDYTLLLNISLYRTPLLHFLCLDNFLCWRIMEKNTLAYYIWVSPCQFNQELQPTSLNSSIFIFYDPFSELIFLAWISIKHCNFERILDGSHEHKKL